MKNINVAIDGPAGAGKSTLAKAVSKKFGYIYVDTGALYRSIAYYSICNGAEDFESGKVTALLSSIKVELKFKDGEQRVFVNGVDVSDYIRTPQVSMGASKVSAIPEVREYLFDLQKNIAASNNVIMDGRDIGTTVLPDADLKIYLTASVEKRAKRRFEQLPVENRPTLEEIMADIEKRDYDDMHREISPLRQAADAITVDTSDMSLEQSIEYISDMVRNIK